MTHRPPRRFGPDSPFDGLDMAPWRPRVEEAELFRLVGETVELLNSSKRRSSLDVAGIKRGLEMAQDCYRRLEGLSRHGRRPSPELRHLFEELLRSTLESYPVLLHFELEARAGLLGPEAVGLLSGAIGDAA